MNNKNLCSSYSFFIRWLKFTITKFVKNNIKGGFDCILENGTLYETTSVILAMGRERRKLGLNNEEEWMGKGVSYCSTCDAPLYRGKESVAVVGGGNAAVEGVILLSKYAKNIPKSSHKKRGFE